MLTPSSGAWTDVYNDSQDALSNGWLIFIIPETELSADIRPNCLFKLLGSTIGKDEIPSSALFIAFPSCLPLISGGSD